MSFEAWHEWSASAASEVWQTTKEKRLKLIVIKLNVILHWLLLHKTSTAHKKNEFFMFEKKQSTKKSHQRRKISKAHSKYRQHI